MLTMLFGTGFGKAKANIEYKFNFSGNLLSISTPQPDTKELGQTLKLETINLWDDSLYNDQAVYVPLRLSWTYKGGWLQNPKGNLFMGIFIEPISLENEKTLFDIETLEDNQNKKLESRFRKHNNELLESGEPERVVKLPTNFARINLHGHSWLTYTLTGGNDSIEYITALTASHILRIGFTKIKNIEAEKRGWPDEVNRDIENIVNSIRLKYASTKM